MEGKKIMDGGSIGRQLSGGSKIVTLDPLREREGKVGLLNE